MQCMKCGQAVSEGNVFCADCLAVMSRYPVNADTPVQILPRKAKAAKKRELSPEELLQRQKRITHRLRLNLFFFGIGVVCLVGVLAYLFLSGQLQFVFAPF